MMRQLQFTGKYVLEVNRLSYVTIASDGGSSVKCLISCEQLADTYGDDSLQSVLGNRTTIESLMQQQYRINGTDQNGELLLSWE